MRSGFIPKVSIPVVLVLLLAGCRPGPPRAPSIGEAYVGPAVLHLRADIPLDSKTVATVKHGDRLEILQRRRKFLRVRSPNGSEGWTEERQLLSAADMDSLKGLTARASRMPSQGVATTYGDLRVHTTPSTQAPSFLLIRNGEKFDVLSHLVVPRVALQRPPLIPPVPKKPKAGPKKRESKSKYPPLPMPKPPPPPADWLDLSKTDLSQEEPEPEPEPTPIPTDNWSLVRVSTGQAGWVLTRRLSMAIPDEVAQYAEGHRIVSYFPVGSVQDGDEKKTTWLWTTIAGAGQPYDFDSVRVFVWSLRHHRYETAYVMHNVVGYEPVILQDVNYGGGKGTGIASGKYPGYSVCLQKKDGQKYRQEFVVLGNLVRFAGEEPCVLPPPVLALQTGAPNAGAANTAAAPATSAPAAPAKEGWFQRLKTKLRGMLHR